MEEKRIAFNLKTDFRMKPQYSCVRSSLRFRLPGMVITVLCPLGTSCTLKHQHTLLKEERLADGDITRCSSEYSDFQ